MEKDLIRLATENIEAFNTADWNRLKTPLADSVVLDEVGTGRRITGHDAITRLYREWKEAFPDCKGAITNTFASGNSVAIEVTWKGTHTGPLVTPKGTIPASGKPFNVKAAQVVTFRDDRVQEIRHYFDMVTLLTQLGAMPK
jgi:steroid delta-isomerase-like uncharacterized protein